MMERMNTPTYDGLPPRQATFVDGRIAGLSQFDAYREAYGAGQLEKSVHECASRLSSTAKVSQALRERRAALAKRTDANEDRIVRGILAVADDPDAKHADILRAWELLGKRLGIFIERHETLNVNVDTSKLDDFTLDELLAFRETRRLKLVEGESHALKPEDSNALVTAPTGNGRHLES